MARNVEQAVNVNSVSRISAGTIIKGEIVSPSDIRIDGEFDGKIIANGRVVVGESAKIKGNIVCCNIDLFGVMEGDIYVKDTLSLKTGCTMNGNLNVRRLYVELGSIFNGNCKMITEDDFDRLAGTQEVPSQE